MSVSTTTFWRILIGGREAVTAVVDATQRPTPCRKLGTASRIHLQAISRLVGDWDAPAPDDSF